MVRHEFDWLRDRRQRALLTQEELAERAGVTARTIRDIETGQTPHPRASTLRLLIDALAATERDAISASGAVPDVPAGTVPRRSRPLESSQIHLYQVRGQARAIGIITGDIRRVRCAEVWVNSENTAMQMARFDEFSISSIIRYEGAGRDSTGQVTDDYVADELAGKMAGRRQVPAGTAIVTGPGELRRHGVRYIAHVAAVQGEPGAGFRQVREIGRCATNVLVEIDRCTDKPPVRSVLFPLLGTGHGGGELRPTVNALFGAVHDYLTTVPASHVTVFFLAYTDVEFAACLDACAAHHLRWIGTSPEGSELPEGTGIQLEIVAEVIGLERRSAPARQAVRARVSALVRHALDGAGLDLGTVGLHWTGNRFAVFLTHDTDPPRVLSDLLPAIHRRLADDNRICQDRIRLRMAVGFASSILVDSAQLRDAVHDHPDSDLIVLISGHLRLPWTDRPAWLWIAPSAAGLD